MSARSTEVRQARAQIRRGLRHGTLTLTALLADPPPVIADIPLFELCTWRRGWGRDKLRRLGQLALADHVNLAVATGDAGDRALDWVSARDQETGRYPIRGRDAP
jgi:hypothetical protein